MTMEGIMKITMNKMCKRQEQMFQMLHNTSTVLDKMKITVVSAMMVALPMGIV